MKKLMLLILVISITGFFQVQAQARKTKAELLPDTVIGAYKAKYKKIEVDQWLEEDSDYKAIFKKGPIKYKATFNVDGKWISTSTEIEKDKVSNGIKKHLKGLDYKGWKISKCEKVETPTVPKMFIVKIKKGKEEQVLNFDATGKILTK